MSRFDDRVQQLRESAELATKGLAELSEDQRVGDDEAIARLEHAIAYAGLVIETTDGELISESAFQALSNELIQIHGNPVAAIANASNWGDTLLDGVSRLPTARGNDVAQAVREAAANYQRSVQQRLHSLGGDIEAVQVKASEVDAAVDTSAAAMEGRLNEVAEGFRAKLAEHDSAIATERSLIDGAKTAQAETFRGAQADRDESFTTALADFKADLTKLLEDSAVTVAERVAEIERMEAESAGLVGAIGLAGTAERYGEEVKEQRRAADFWRWCTVLLVGLAVAAIVVIVFTLGDEPRWEEVVGKFSASLLFGGIATYAARQSARHRHREEHARTLQLELTAFGPFIEPLTSDQQEEERVVMTRKTFGKASAASPTAGEEPGPAPLSFLLSAEGTRESLALPHSRSYP